MVCTSPTCLTTTDVCRPPGGVRQDNRFPPTKGGGRGVRPAGGAGCQNLVVGGDRDKRVKSQISW